MTITVKFSGYQPCQVSVLNQHFEDRHRHHHQQQQQRLMCQWGLRSHAYIPWLWAGGRGWLSACTRPCFAIGVFLGR